MDFNYLGFVNRVLLMAKQTYVSDFSSVAIGSDAYNVQICVNDTLSDLQHLLRINKRKTDFSFPTVASQRTYNISRRVEFPFIDLYQKNNDIRLTLMDQEEFDRLMPDDSEATGDPEKYYLWGYAGIENQPVATGEKVYCVSDDAGDDDVDCVISGWDTNERYITEVITLSGTSEQASTYTYKFLGNISKAKSSGSVTFRNSGSTTTFLVLNAKETSKRILSIGLYPIPSSVITIYGRGYLSIPSLENEYEAPIGLSEDHLNAIVAGSYWRYMKYDP